MRIVQDLFISFALFLNYGKMMGKHNERKNSMATYNDNSSGLNHAITCNGRGDGRKSKSEY